MNVKKLNQRLSHSPLPQPNITHKSNSYLLTVIIVLSYNESIQNFQLKHIKNSQNLFLKKKKLQT